MCRGSIGNGVREYYNEKIENMPRVYYQYSRCGDGKDHFVGIKVPDEVLKLYADYYKQKDIREELKEALEFAYKQNPKDDGNPASFGYFWADQLMWKFAPEKVKWLT